VGIVRNVIAVLVKFRIAVVLPHVDFELPGRTPPLPAIVGIAQAEITFGGPHGEPFARHDPDVEKAEEQSTEMSKVGDGPAAAGGGSVEGAAQLYRTTSGHEGVGRDWTRKRKTAA